MTRMGFHFSPLKQTKAARNRINARYWKWPNTKEIVPFRNKVVIRMPRPAQVTDSAAEHRVTDRKLLKLLIENYGGGPVGLETLSAALGEDAGTMEDVCEPYLMQNGFLKRTPRGRMATEKAYAHLGYAIPPMQETLPFV